jgi:hypothetical protein
MCELRETRVNIWIDFEIVTFVSDVVADEPDA